MVDRLDVYTLQQTSTEWIPEWKFSHTRRLKVCEGGGADMMGDDVVIDGDVEMMAVL